MSRPFRYPRPASRAGRDEMSLLYAARENSPTPTIVDPPPRRFRRTTRLPHR